MLAGLLLATVASSGNGTSLTEVTWPKRASEVGPGVFESQVIEGSGPWDEAVVSWNADRAEVGTLEVEVRAVYPERTSRWYKLARWSLGESGMSSIKGQKDADGEVETDILKLRAKATGIQLRFRLAGELSLKRWSVSLRDSSASSSSSSHRTAWGKLIDVPQRSQMSYPNGNVLCSPTSVSMILAHWSKVRERPDLDRDVPEVQKGVYDPEWPGTGNWSFNVAFAGSIPGMRALAARLSGISELEKWISRGVPIATSVSYDLLKGKGKKGPDDGHLVVLVGFSADGEPLFNDPGRGSQVRQTYRRADFLAAWAASGNTVYLITPDDDAYTR